MDTKYNFIGEAEGSKLLVVSDKEAVINYSYKKAKAKERSQADLNLNDFIDVKGWKAIGNKLSSDKVYTVKLKEEIADESEVEEVVEDKSQKIEEAKIEESIVKDSIEEERETDEPKPKKKEEKPKATETPSKETEESGPKEDKSIGAGTTIDLDVKPSKEGDDQLGLF